VLFNGGFVGLKIFKNANGYIIGTYTYQEPDYTRGLFALIKSLPQDPRWTLQNRPYVDGAKPAIGAGAQAGVL